jgi:hypothetical protein
MGGLRGNDALFGLKKQSAKGSPATTGSAYDVMPFSGGSIGPVRAVENLSETDSSRDQGVAYVQNFSVEGTPEVYVRDSNIHHILESVLGNLTSDAGPTNYTHDIIPAAALPYYTFYREIGDTLYERFEDCKVSEVTISAEAGQPLTASLNIMGRNSVRLASQPASLATPASGAVYNFNEATVTLAGGATSLVGSFECTISNNVSMQQTDDAKPYDVVEGLREVSLGFTLIFESLDEYNRFNYGSTSGTAQSSTLATTSANFSFSKGTGTNEIKFDFPSIAYQEFPVEANPGGDPVTVDVRAVAQRNASGVIACEVINQVAT